MGPNCDGCGRTDKALFRVNAKGIPGIFKCRPCIDGVPRIGLGLERELLDAMGVGAEPPPEGHPRAVPAPTQSDDDAR